MCVYILLLIVTDREREKLVKFVVLASESMSCCGLWAGTRHVSMLTTYTALAS